MTQDLIRDDRFLCRSCGRPNEWSPKPQRFGWFEIMAVAGLFLFFGGFLQKWEADHHIFRWENPKGIVKVLKKFDPYRYQMRFPSGDYTVFICHSYRPCLPEGAVLTSFRYIDRGDCYDVAPMGLGYNFLQDEQGNDIDEKGRIIFDAVKDTCE